MVYLYKKSLPKEQKNVSVEEQFEEISLDSRKRKEKAEGKEESSREKGRNSSLIFFSMDRSKLICVFVLFAINLLNYMDRFTVAGILNDVQKFYGIGDKMAGFLQTVFIIFFMTIAPICGFLGDRFNRKRIMLIGLSVWVGAVFASSFVSENHFFLFLLFRGVVGIGEASYAVIAPTIIADLFVGRMRSRILMFFYFAIPVGSGLGYVVGSSATSLAKSAVGSADCPFCWQWGIRVTPLLGLFCIITLLLFVKEPVRGQAEQSVAQPMPTTYETATISPSPRRSLTSSAEGQNGNGWKESWHRLRSYGKSYCADIGDLMANRTFVWSTLAYTAVIFVTGTLSWWGPTAVEHAKAMEEHLNDTSKLGPAEKNQISLIFGVITCVAGIFGVSLGTLISQQWKSGKFCFKHCRSERADPIISAFGSFVAAPLMFIAFFLITTNQLLSWLVVFLTILCLCLNWAINVDMLMSIIVPERRSIASAVQILFSHLLGDASGPYLVGAISDFVRGTSDLPADRFHSLIVAFYLPNVLLFLSGAAFLGAAYSLPADLKRMEAERERRDRGPNPTNSATISPSSANIGPPGRQNDAFE